MMIGKVIGNAWATRKEDALSGHKLLIVRPVDYDQDGFATTKKLYPIVAVDRIGAGIGELVLVSQGSSARKALMDKDAPIDAAIVGIVDQIDINEEV